MYNFQCKAFNSQLFLVKHIIKILKLSIVTEQDCSDLNVILGEF